MAACSISRRLVSLLKLLGEQRVEQRDGAAEDVGQDGQRELQRQQPADAVEQAACQPFAQVVRGAWSTAPSKTTSSMISLPT